MGRRVKYEFHKHADCARAKLIQYASDPLLAECRGEVHVASTVIACPMFKQRIDEPQIEHRPKRIGITDNYIL